MRHSCGFVFDGVPSERDGEILPFARFDELTAGGQQPMDAESTLRAEWGAFVSASSASAQRDRRRAIPRIIVEHTLGRAASKREITAIGKLCCRVDKSYGGKTYTVTDGDVCAALEAVSR